MAIKGEEKMKLILFFTIILIGCANVKKTFSAQKIVVAQDGSGNFKTIQEAINSISKTKMQTIILIKKGTYQEKIYVEKSNIIFEGESMSETIITQSIARDEWRCTHPDDWGVATMNISGKEITLKNLTIQNTYGLDTQKENIIDCPLDTAKPRKTVSVTSHQMALRVMNGGTKLKAINCHFTAYGGDTVSPWEVSIGYWYFKDCIIEGGVDFYCPRGWAWAEDCEFIANSGTAAIWHDGSADSTSATVLKNCSFKGFDNFNLGRYHRDAQFYLLNCTFADNMNNNEIYLVKTNNIIKWGKRIYYYNCTRNAGNYNWFHNNITAEEVKQVTIDWLFGKKWNPLIN